MLSKAQVKDIRALATAKGRAAAGAFVAEGDKIVCEWLASGQPVQLLAATEEWMIARHTFLGKAAITTVITVSEEELARATFLVTPQRVLIVAAMPEQPAQLPVDEWALALDDIQDPGNVGTIIRIADWFGIRHVIASPESADFFNPKVVQSAMGAHLRVALYKASLEKFLSGIKVPAIAATLGGENIYRFKKQEKGVLIIGNESRGISDKLRGLCDFEVSIPKRGGAESLNAAVSTGILCALLLEG